MNHTNHDKLEAVKRELGFRRRVYAQRVRDNRMTQALADYQISVFEAIEADYEKLEEGERLL
jgi:hypothetical protein